MSPARTAAFSVLRQVERGAHASDQLLTRTETLSSRDAGLASEIVFGVLRFQAQLEFLIRHYSGRDSGKLDEDIRLILRMGIYQLRYLDRIPPHAAVSESVELAKRAHRRSAAGLVNAVLRKVDRKPVRWPDRATELSAPEWLLERWERHFGAERADGIARAALKPPETFVRVPAGPSEPAPDLEPTEAPGCFRLLSGSAGGWRVQDIGSQSIVPLLELRAGLSFLDLCAAPGNKTAQALESGVRTVACDRQWTRLSRLKGLGCHLVVADGTQPLPFRRRFDRILVDAPCSGTGTLGRNPEIKWRLRARDLDALRARQEALLRQALAILAPGGRLVYSTCSLEREENEEVLTAVLKREPDEVRLRIPGQVPGDGFFAAVITSE